MGCYSATVERVKRFEIKRPEGAPAAYVCYYIILSEDEYEKVKQWVVNSAVLHRRSKV